MPGGRRSAREEMEARKIEKREGRRWKSPYEALNHRFSRLSDTEKVKEAYEIDSKQSNTDPPKRHEPPCT